MLSEIVSNRQGLGWLLAESLPTLDVPVLQATFVEASFLAVGLAVPFLLAGAWFHREAPVSSAKVFLAPARGSFRDVVKNGFRQFGLGLRSSPAISFWIGIVLFAIPVGLALGAPLLSPYSPTQAVYPLRSTVAPARLTNSSPRLLAMRRKIILAELTSDGPGKSRNPETATAAMNCSVPIPALPA